MDTSLPNPKDIVPENERESVEDGSRYAVGPFFMVVLATG